MSITRPTSDQVTFTSDNTGTHVLDDYLEDAERGGLALATLIAKIFDTNGDPVADAFHDFLGLELRVDANTGELTYGYSSNPAQDDPTGTFIFNFRGPWAATTAYERLDLITQNGVTYIATADFTSPATFDQANLYPISTGLGGVVHADGSDPAAGTLDTKLKAIGATVSVIDDAGTRKVQIDLQPTLDQIAADIEAAKPTQASLMAAGAI